MTKFPRDTRPMQSIGKTPVLSFCSFKLAETLAFHVLGGRGELEVFLGGESRESCRTQGFRQDQAADASFGGRVEEVVIMQPSVDHPTPVTLILRGSRERGSGIRAQRRPRTRGRRSGEVCDHCGSFFRRDRFVRQEKGA